MKDCAWLCIADSEVDGLEYLLSFEQGDEG